MTDVLGHPFPWCKLYENKQSRFLFVLTRLGRQAHGLFKVPKRANSAMIYEQYITLSVLAGRPAIRHSLQLQVDSSNTRHQRLYFVKDLRGTTAGGTGCARRLITYIDSNMNGDDRETLCGFKTKFCGWMIWKEVMNSVNILVNTPFQVFLSSLELSQASSSL